MQQLGSLDNLMIEGEIPNVPLHMSAAMLYDASRAPAGSKLFGQMRDMLAGIIEDHLPILHCRVEELPLHMDKAYWVVDDEFELRHHMEHVTLCAARDWQEFHRMLGEFHARPLSLDKPLWEFMLVEGLDALDGIPKGGIAVFVKIHHAVMDGNSAMRLLRSFHSASPEPGAAPLADSLPPVDPADKTYRASPWWVKYARAWIHSIERPVELTGSLTRLLPHLWQRGEPGQKTQQPPIPQTRFNHPVAADRVVGHVRLELKDLKKLEKKYGCTINDIALCTVSGALRHYLAHKGEFPTDDLVAAMPIDMRPKHEDGDIGNQVSLARIRLHADIENISERLQGIQAQTTYSKKESRKGDSPALLNIVDEIPPALIIWLGQWLISSGYLEKLPPLVNTVVTNVPGLRDEAYMFGARLVDYIGLGPLAPNAGLFHTVSSTTEHVNISFTSTRDFVGDGSDYCAALEHSYQELISSSV
jgi:diacylglycerol O-acyltransferase